MAEHFYGKFRSLHTTNGGGELFLECLLVVGSQCATDAPEHSQVLSFLQSRSEKGAGWKFFDVDPLPEALNAESASRFLIYMVDCLAQSLVNEDIAQPLQKYFDNDRKFQLRWAAFTAELHEMLRESVQFDAPALQFTFPDANDERIFMLNRLHEQKAHAYKQERAFLAEQLRLLDQIIELEQRGEPSKPMWLFYNDKADILLKMNNRSDAIIALNEAATHAEGETRQALIDDAEYYELQLLEMRENATETPPPKTDE